MGKRFLLLLFSIYGHIIFAQQWVDSIDAARDAYQKKDYSSAERIYRAHYKKAKSKGGIDEELAQTKYRQRRFNSAIEYYQKKLKNVNKRSEKARINIIWVMHISKEEITLVPLNRIKARFA